MGQTLESHTTMALAQEVELSAYLRAQCFFGELQQKHPAG